MKWTLQKYKYLLFLTAYYLWSPAILLFAAEDMYFQNSELWKSDSADAKFRSTTPDKIKLTFKIQGDPDDYYGFGFYNILGDKNLSHYQGIWVSIQCTVNQPISFTFTLTDDKKHSLSYQKQYTIMQTKEDALTAVQINYGTIPLSTYQKVTFFIPFQGNSVLNSVLDYSHITTFGFSFSGKGKTRGNVVLSNVRLVSEKESFHYFSYTGSKIIGDSVVYISTYDSISVTYQIESDHAFRFLNPNVDGITLTADGTLTVSPLVRAQTLFLQASSEDGIFLEYPVELLESWTQYTKNAPKIPSSIQASGAIRDYVLFQNRKLIYYIRICILCIFTALSGFYFYYRKKYKQLKEEDT
ncbi:hypothetical protein [Anaeromicropila populeti]|uniref:hypothetical protein n=1 Tax=Anaeromicropila populeti TaxID=37658 RepID=UPI000B8566C9|nr:hypothetical protein [Anaeromicropila populeti]